VADSNQGIQHGQINSCIDYAHDSEASVARVSYGLASLAGITAKPMAWMLFFRLAHLRRSRSGRLTALLGGFTTHHTAPLPRPMSVFSLRESEQYSGCPAASF